MSVYGSDDRLKKKKCRTQRKIKIQRCATFNEHFRFYEGQLSYIFGCAVAAAANKQQQKKANRPIFFHLDYTRTYIYSAGVCFTPREKSSAVFSCVCVFKNIKVNRGFCLKEEKKQQTWRISWRKHLKRKYAGKPYAPATKSKK